jgi:hypothetical protein
MQKKTRNILIAIVVVLIILAVAYWWWITKDTVKFLITQITPAAGQAGSTALILTGSTSSSSSPTGWVGKSITLHTQSLGKLKSTVAAVALSGGAGTVTTAAIAFPAAFTYTPATSDYARISLGL